MDRPSPQEKPAEELPYAEREGILWDAARRYLRGEITSRELSEIEDKYDLSLRKIVIHSPEVTGYSNRQEKKSA